MSIDPRFHKLAQEWLEDAGLPDRLVTEYVDQLAEQFQDAAEQCVQFDIPESEHAREEAARDAYWDSKIDEARGK